MSLFTKLRTLSEQIEGPVAFSHVCECVVLGFEGDRFGVKQAVMSQVLDWDNACVEEDKALSGVVIGCTGGVVKGMGQTDLCSPSTMDELSTTFLAPSDFSGELRLSRWNEFSLTRPCNLLLTNRQLPFNLMLLRGTPD